MYCMTFPPFTHPHTSAHRAHTHTHSHSLSTSHHTVPSYCLVKLLGTSTIVPHSHHYPSQFTNTLGPASWRRHLQSRPVGNRPAAVREHYSPLPHVPNASRSRSQFPRHHLCRKSDLSPRLEGAGVRFLGLGLEP